jgi:hypothetical protein
MKNLLNNYKASLAKVNEIETAYENNPEDERLEREYDKAYNDNFSDYIALAEALVEITKGQISFNVAKTMIVTKLDKLEAIIELA